MISENSKLKESMERLHSETSQLELQHREQMREAINNLEAVKEAHKKDIIQVQAITSQHSKKKLKSLSCFKKIAWEINYFEIKLDTALQCKPDTLHYMFS